MQPIFKSRLENTLCAERKCLYFITLNYIHRCKRLNKVDAMMRHQLIALDMHINAFTTFEIKTQRGIIFLDNISVKLEFQNLLQRCRGCLSILLEQDCHRVCWTERNHHLRTFVTALTLNFEFYHVFVGDGSDSSFIRNCSI